MGKPLKIFFLGALILPIVDYLVIVQTSALSLDSFPAPTTTDTLDNTGLLYSSLCLAHYTRIVTP
jgi:hypothetical protein